MRRAIAPLFLLLMSLNYAVSTVLSLKRHKEGVNQVAFAP